MGRAAHSVEAKAVVCIEVAVSPPHALVLAWAALWSSSCASRLSASASAPHHPPVTRSERRRWRSTAPACAFWAVITTRPLPQQPELHFLSYYAVWDEMSLGRLVRTAPILRKLLVQELLKS
jgi:hypothetical protein